MPLNAKVAAEIDRQVSIGKMTTDYAARYKETAADLPDDFQAAFLAGPDYQRSQQTLKTERDAHAQNVAKWKEWETKSQANIDSMAAREAAAQARVRELEALSASGTLTMPDENAVLKEINSLKTSITGMQDNMKAAGFLTKADLEKAGEERDARLLNWFGGYMSDRQKVTDEHMATFGKPLAAKEYDDLVAYASEEQKRLGRTLPLEEAYRSKYGTQLEEIKANKYRAEGEAAATARLGVPGGGSPSGGAPSLDQGPLGIRMREWAGKDLTPGDGDLQTAKAKAVELLRGTV